MRSMTFGPLLLLAAACTDGDSAKTDSKDGQETGQNQNPPTDDDGDGITTTDGDCDDADAEVHVGAVEICGNGKDDNCDGRQDEGFPDTDVDGTPDCSDAEDCDGKDNNGDGTVDEGYADADGDHVADCVGTERCDGVDNDEDGEIDEGYDADGDGYTQCGSDTEAADCDDSRASVHPDGEEIDGDGLDNDCDGIADEGTYAEGDLAITEIMNNPSTVGDPDGEWVELYNPTDHDVTLSGLTFTSGPGESFQLDAGGTWALGPGEFVVIGGNTNSAANGGAHVDAAWTDLFLSNETDEFQVLADTLVIDVVTWDDGATMPDANGASMGVENGLYDATKNDNAKNWCEALTDWPGSLGDAGSPGDENEICPNVDHDGDGYTALEGDCDDNDDRVYPGAPETKSDKDYNCDGTVDMNPVAFASYLTLFPQVCAPLTLDGASSYDPEGKTLTYAWSVEAVPAGSAITVADFDDATSVSPTLHPDVSGDYVFSLVVSDGVTESVPDNVVVSVDERGVNKPPKADAGKDQTASAYAKCTPISYGASYSCSTCADLRFDLDGAASSDADGDELTYEWNVISGGTYGSVTATSETGAQVLVTGAPTDYGVPTDTEVVVELKVTDCLGDTDTALVSITYTCTGN